MGKPSECSVRMPRFLEREKENTLEHVIRQHSLPLMIQYIQYVMERVKIKFVYVIWTKHSCRSPISQWHAHRCFTTNLHPIILWHWVWIDIFKELDEKEMCQFVKTINDYMMLCYVIFVVQLSNKIQTVSIVRHHAQPLCFVRAVSSVHSSFQWCCTETIHTAGILLELPCIQMEMNKLAIVCSGQYLLNDFVPAGKPHSEENIFFCIWQPNMFLSIE